MPTENPEGFVNGETDNSTVSNAGSQSTASNAVPAAASAATPVTRRRRGGRRVVRGTGAAGASLELQVQDHSAPLFEAPALPSESKSDTAADSAEASADAVKTAAGSRANVAFDDEDDRRPVRRRSRARHIDDDDEADFEERPVRRRRRTDAFTDDDSDERLLDAVDSLPEGHDAVRRGKPMTSLLFQEPVLPATRYNSHNDDEDDDDDEPRLRRRARSRRFDDDADFEERPTRSRRRSRDDRDDRDARDADREASADRNGRRRNADAAGSGNTNANDAQAQSDTDTESTDDSRRSRRSRRLNAQERRAAAEVEQIEEDLELDDISYAPIAEEENDGDEESMDSTRTRSRRRRRRGSRVEASAADGDSADNSEEDGDARRTRDEHDAQEDDGEQTITRRRRRRRGSKNAEAGEEAPAEEPVIRRSRKQQYIDEITDVEGSTRLEAKKQRRRDNRRERSRQSQLMEQDFLARRENVDRLMVVREREHHTQISVVEDNVLVEHYVSDIQEVQTVGNIYLGRVQNVLPSMEAAFVDIGQARNGVLYAGEVNWDAARLEGQPRRIELAFKSGDPVLVQVTKDPIGHKGARLTSQVTLAGRFLVLVPSGGMTGVSRKLSERERSRLKNIVSKIAPKDMGVIIRTAAEGASEEAIVKDLESLVRQWERINAKREEFWHGKRPKLLQGEPDVAIRVVRDIFNDDFNKLIVEGDKVYDRIEEYLDTMAPDLKDKLEKWDPAEHEGKDVFDKWQIDSQLRKGMERQVYLPSGGSIVIDRTEAMTTIDVNTGRFIGRGKSLEETVTRCNLEASEEIARQLRLRDIGGMVMIDYVDMVMPANRDLVLRRLVECLARDRTKHQVAEVTSLGLVQMTRKRIGQGLVEAFSEECPTCKGRGFILHDQPTVSADYDDPYALRGGDPFVKTNKHGRGTAPAPEPAGSSADVKAKLAQIAAAAVAANNADEE
ncbi:ribonuclease E/G [Bifidobacterium felsineum]|uniref:Ribonuclease E n=1 Tax=Bifidobacterium felsineum TaxID=2045440 RepID=A0A2M9HIG2_9BIFI|nr:ribonuclease E/G [Bifidobacterium felsineum]